MEKTNVIFMNYPEKRREPTRIKVDTWTEQQKMDFLSAIRKHTPQEYALPCSFNVHFDKSVIHSRNFDVPKLFNPHAPKNKPNELIIEIIPQIEDVDCYATRPAACPNCIKNGACESWFIKKYIGQTLFPNQYKQR